MATDSTPVDRCQTDSELQQCADTCDALAALIRAPLTPPGATRGRCVRLDGRVGCGCFDDEGATDGVGDDVSQLFIDDGRCSVFGRLGECLFEPADFPGCTLPVSEGGVVGDEGSEAACAAVCATVDERRTAAAAANPDVVVEPSCDLECSCRLFEGERCAIAAGIQALDEGTTADDVATQVFIRPCTSGDL